MTKLSEFSKYGIVLQDEEREGTELFRQTDAVGWRLASVPVDAQEVMEMSLHDNTPEAFFPIAGTVVLTLSKDESFKCCEEFLLDRPLMIRPGIWHGLHTLSEKGMILVAENADVNLEKKRYKGGRNDQAG